MRCTLETTQQDTEVAQKDTETTQECRQTAQKDTQTTQSGGKDDMWKNEVNRDALASDEMQAAMLQQQSKNIVLEMTVETLLL